MVDISMEWMFYTYGIYSYADYIFQGKYKCETAPFPQQITCKSFHYKIRFIPERLRIKLDIGLISMNRF